MKYTMEAVDEVRKRARVGYEEAKEALDLTDGDVLDAIIYLEKKKHVDKNLVKNLTDKFKSFVNEGFISQIQVFKNGQKIFDIPVVAGVAMMAIWTVPFTAALIFAIASKCDIRIVKRDGATIHISEVTAEKLSEMFHTLKNEVSKAKYRWNHCGEDEQCREEEEEILDLSDDETHGDCCCHHDDRR